MDGDRPLVPVGDNLKWHGDDRAAMGRGMGVIGPLGDVLEMMGDGVW